MQVDEDGEEGRGPAMFSLQRFPEDVFGDEDSAAKMYPVTELDAERVCVCVCALCVCLSAFVMPSHLFATPVFSFQSMLCAFCASPSLVKQKNILYLPPEGLACLEPLSSMRRVGSAAPFLKVYRRNVFGFDFRGTDDLQDGVFRSDCVVCVPPEMYASSLTPL